MGDARAAIKPFGRIFTLGRYVSKRRREMEAKVGKEEAVIYGEAYPYGISVRREDGTVHKKDIEECKKYTGERHHFSFLFGMIQLKHNLYAIVFNRSRKVCVLQGSEIYSALEPRLIPLLHQKGQDAGDQEAVELMKEVLTVGMVYYSYQRDMTVRYPRVDPKSHGIDPSVTVDRYQLNYFALSPLRQAGFKEWLVPAIMGYVSAVDLLTPTGTVVLALVTRRSRLRMGVRYVVRGGDAQGFTANNCETEQIVVLPGGKTYSYVQTRGSIPLAWEQKANIKYKPKPRLVGEGEQTVTRSHFRDQVERYGPQVMINLIDQKGAEKVLCDAYEKAVQEMADGDLQLEHFDFHHECRKMQYQNLDKLYDRVEDKVKEFGTTVVDGEGKVTTQQKGVFRVNCMDNLDRTNVVQSMFARRMLAGILQAELGESLADHMHKFRAMWADNADAVSTQYAGTGALKTDYTRTGKRTKRGMLQDGINSCMRYIQNNFYDGGKQDGYSLLSGEVQIKASGKHPLSVPRKRGIASIGMILAVLFSSMMVGHYYYGGPLPARVSIPLALTLSSFVTLKIAAWLGTRLVDTPRLS